MILFPAVRKGCSVKENVKRRDFFDYALTDLQWARPLLDGRLELIPLRDLPVHSDYGSDSFCCLNDRLVTSIHRYVRDSSGYPGSRALVQTTAVQDTAEILPCPLPLSLDGVPAYGGLKLMPDGGFLAIISPRPLYDDQEALKNAPAPLPLSRPHLVCYGPDGTQRWSFPGIQFICQIAEDHIYALTDWDKGIYLLNLRLEGSEAARYLVPHSPYSTKCVILNDTPYVLEPRGHQTDSLLHRLTPGLRPDGEILVPYMSSLALSPDGSLLYAVGSASGLMAINTVALQTIHSRPWGGSCSTPMVDGQNRLWIENCGYFECYSPELKRISRCPIKGSVYGVYRNAVGQVCAVTFQRAECMIRVYRFS